MRSLNLFKVFSVVLTVVFVLELVLSADVMAAEKKGKGKGKKGPSYLNQFKDLDLTDDQINKIISSKEGKAMAESNEKWKGIKDKKGPEATEMKGERKKLKKSFDKMIAGVLTDDQKAKMKELKANKGSKDREKKKKK